MSSDNDNGPGTDDPGPNALAPATLEPAPATVLAVGSAVVSSVSVEVPVPVPGMTGGQGHLDLPPEVPAEFAIARDLAARERLSRPKGPSYWMDKGMTAAVVFRCSLCRFRFERGDDYTVDFDGTVMGPFSFQQVSDIITMGPHDNIRLNHLTRGKFQVTRDYPLSERLFETYAAYHPACLAHWKSDDEGCEDDGDEDEREERQPPDQGQQSAQEQTEPILSRELTAATSYAFTPSWTDEIRRRDRIRAILCDKLVASFPTDGLPRELWTAIADNDMVHLYAVQVAQKMWKQRNSFSAELDRSRGLWAHYIFIEGVRYIERLTREPPKVMPSGETGVNKTWMKLLDGRDARSKTVLYVLEDYLGVRQLVFTEPGEDFSSRVTASYPDGRLDDAGNNMWWRRVNLPPWLHLRVWADGVKIRSVVATVPRTECDGYPEEDKMVWRTPQIRLSEHLEPKDLRTARLKPSPRILRHGVFPSWYMTSMHCNAPGTTGYSAYWDNGLVALHAHRQGDSPSSLASLYRDYALMAPSGVWIYFPVAEGEYLTSVYHRDNYRYDQTAFMFRTNIGRRWLTGTGLVPPSRPRSTTNVFRYLCTLTHDRPLRVYFNTLPISCLNMAFERTINERLPEKNVVWNIKNPPVLMNNDMCCASNVKLEGAVRVTPSYKKPPWSSGLTMFHGPRPAERILCGLLFEYENGRPPAVLGEYRLDGVQGGRESIDLTGVDMLYFGYHFDSDILMHLAQISTEEREDEENIKWTGVSMTAIMEMWYSSVYSRLYFTGPQKSDASTQGKAGGKILSSQTLGDEKI